MALNPLPLVTLEYIESRQKPHIVLFLREGKTRKQILINDFKPYFWVPIEEYPEYLISGSNSTLEISSTLSSEKFTKIYTRLPQDVPHFRQMYSRTGESDVHFTTRYLIDRIPQIEKSELRIQYTDIEFDQETNQIISIAIYDNYLDKVVCFVWKEGVKPEKVNEIFIFPKTGYKFNASIHLYNNKLSMLQGYIKFIGDTDPDILTGWYFVQYDIPTLFNEINGTKKLSASWLSPLGKCYIKKETKYEEDRAVCAGRILWDMLKAYRKLQPIDLPDKSLEAIAQKELGEGKKPLEHSIGWLWRNDLKSLIEYNTKDSVLVYRLDKKCGIIDYFDSLRRWIGCEWNILFKSSLLWDVKILRKVNGKVVLPTKQKIEIGAIKGAEVFEPTSKGIHDWIILLDLKSLYPSIIITFNISPETLLKEEYSNQDSINLKNGISFKKNPIGLLPQILLEMVEERKKYKTEMGKYPFGTDEYDVYDHLQTGVKVMMNALYGSTISKGGKRNSYSNFRLASKEVGSSVTFMGREIIKFVRQKTEELGFKVLYGDTDSIFIFAKKNSIDDVIEETSSLVETLNVMLKEFVKELGGESMDSHIKIEPKKIYSQFMMFEKKQTKKGEVAKKRYGGRLAWNEGKKCDELDYMGIEARRSNSSELSRKLQKKVLRILFKYEPIEKLKVYIGEAKYMLSKPQPDYDEIGIPQGLSKELNKYDTDNPWVRGAKYSNEYLGANFGVGDKPKLIYVKSVPKDYPRTDVVCFRNERDLLKGFGLDVEKMFEKSVVMKLEQVLDAANLTFEEVFYGQSKLGNF